LKAESVDLQAGVACLTGTSAGNVSLTALAKVPTYNDAAVPRRAFEDRAVGIDTDPALHADLRGIKKEFTSAGNIRFVGDTDDSHCDRFWAKALRQHAARQRPGTPSITVAHDDEPWGQYNWTP
jgi:phage FluMu gp28-like protein